MRNIADLLGIHDLHVPCFYNLKTFLASTEDGEMGFTNDLGENYVLVRENNTLLLTYPPCDYTGDPDVVSRFNAYSTYALELV